MRKTGGMDANVRTTLDKLARISANMIWLNEDDWQEWGCQELLKKLWEPCLKEFHSRKKTSERDKSYQVGKNE